MATSSQEIFRPHLEVKGQCLLNGELKVSGAKNSALVLMAASLLTKEVLVINNVPSLTDIDGMSKILLTMGVDINRSSDVVHIQAESLRHVELPYELVHGSSTWRRLSA